MSRLKDNNNLTKKRGMKANEKKNKPLNIPDVSNWHFLPELPETNKEVLIAYKYDKKPIQGFWNGKKWIGSFETRDYMIDCYANNSELNIPEYIYAWRELPDCPEVPTPF